MLVGGTQGPTYGIDGVGPDAAANVAELADGEILLGLLTARSGPLAGIDHGMINAAWLARSEIDAAGGVLGEEPGILVWDDGASGEVAQQAWARLIADPEVVATVGPTTFRALRMVTGLDANPPIPSLPMALVSASSTLLEGDYDYAPKAFSVINALSFWAPSAHRYLAENLRADTGASLGMSWSGDAFDTIPPSVTLIASEYYSAPDPAWVDYTTFDFGEKVDALLAEQPEVIALATFWTDGARTTPELSAHRHLRPPPQLGSERGDNYPDTGGQARLLALSVSGRPIQSSIKWDRASGIGGSIS